MRNLSLIAKFRIIASYLTLAFLGVGLTSCWGWLIVGASLRTTWSRGVYVSLMASGVVGIACLVALRLCGFSARYKRLMRILPMASD